MKTAIVTSEDKGRTWNVEVEGFANALWRGVAFSDTTGVFLGYKNSTGTTGPQGFIITGVGSEFTDPNGLTQFNTTIDVLSLIHI